MTKDTVHVFMTGLAFGESPRWHDGRLWFSHWGAQEIIAVDPKGKSEVVVRLPFPSFPFSIDWLPDGRLLIISSSDQPLVRQESDGSLVPHADLSRGFNEIVVDGRGNAYINGAGFNPLAGEKFAPGIITLVTPDGSAKQVAEGIAFPNGMAITPDTSTLIVADSYGKKLTAFDIADDGGLSKQRVWADLGEGTPDGICIDARSAQFGMRTSPTSVACAFAKVVKCCKWSSLTVAASLACWGARTARRCLSWQPNGMAWRT